MNLDGRLGRNTNRGQEGNELETAVLKIWKKDVLKNRYHMISDLTKKQHRNAMEGMENRKTLLSHVEYVWECR